MEFDAIDTNDDGVIDRNEWRAALQSSSAPMASLKTQLTSLKDAVSTGEHKNLSKLVQVSSPWPSCSLLLT